MRIFSCVLIFMVLMGCEKPTLISISSDFEGTWVHYVRPGDYHKVMIAEDGTGTMEWYVGNKINRSTKEKTWYLKENELFFGKAAFNGERYDVDKYPTVAWEEIVDFYDTIPELDFYMILDDFYYHKIE